MRSAALVLIVLVALGAAVAPLVAQTKAPAPAPGAEAAPGRRAQARRARSRATSSVGPRSNAPIVIDADRMEAFKKEGLVVFTGNVVAKQNNSVQYADRMEVYLDDKGDRIAPHRLDRQRADHHQGLPHRHREAGRVLRRRAARRAHRRRRVWQDDNVVTGERITIYLAEDRSVVEGGTQERVKAVFYPKRGRGQGRRSRKRPARQEGREATGACG